MEQETSGACSCSYPKNGLDWIGVDSRGWLSGNLSDALCPCATIGRDRRVPAGSSVLQTDNVDDVCVEYGCGAVSG
jgi:hypothetical protein